MKAILENAMVVEVNTVPNKEGKVYPKVLVVETGKQYPKLIALRIKSEEVPKVINSVGQVLDVQVDAEEYNGTKGPYTSYTWLGFRKAA